MHYIILFFITFNLIICSTISSYVIDSTNNNPIKDVVVICGTSKTITNKDGYFKIDTSGYENITFQHIKYNKITKGIDEIESTIKLNSRIFFLNVKVFGSINDNTLFKENSSVKIITKESIHLKNVEHFEDILPFAPNLTFSGASSRPRFFQIRGIGEKSQYFGEGGPNYSVGLLIDNIDFSGIGMIANAFDIEQVEFFNGSQSYLYGPNSLAGLINITSKMPSLSKEIKIKTGISNYGGNQFGILFSGPISKKSFYGITYNQNYNDGYKYNKYKNIKTSNMKDEKYFKLHYHFIDSFSSIKISHIIADHNNLYDDWSPDNNKEITYSDSTGRDSQYTYATSFNFNKEINKDLNISLISTYSKNNLVHSYDGDWANDEYWLLEHGWNKDDGRWSFTDNTRRNRKSNSIEFRINKNYKNYISNKNNITFGYYQSNKNESDKSNGWIFGGTATDGQSLYKIHNKSFYFQLKDFLKDDIYFQINYRYEHSNIVYNGSFNSNTQKIDSKKTFDMTGYKLSLNKSFNNINTFISYSKGYKNGGINQSHLISENNRFYNPEYVKNIELGLKYQYQATQGSFTYFYMLREHQHLFLSNQIDNPNNYFFYSINANDGINKGFEFQNHLFLNKKFNIQTSLSCLKTFIDKVTILNKSLLDRESSYAPEINYAFIFNNLLTDNLTINTTIHGKSSYYLSDNHDAKSNGYSLLDINIQHKKNNLTFNLWVKNISDKRYPIKAFYFVLTPDNIEDFYYQYNKPRTYGINLTYDI